MGRDQERAQPARIRPTRLVNQFFAAQPSDPGALSFGWLTSGALGRDGVVWIGTFANGLNSLDSLATKFHFIDPNLRPAASARMTTRCCGSAPTPVRLIRFDRKRRKADVYTRFVTDDGAEVNLRRRGSAGST